MQLCGYGCGKEAKFPPRKGMLKWCCKENLQQCPKMRENQSTKIKVLRADLDSEYNTDEYWLKQSKNSKSNWNNPESQFRSEEYKNLRSEIMKDKWRYSNDELLKGQKRKSLLYNLRLLKKKHPFFYKIEKPKFVSGKIQVRCASCEKWFVPTREQLFERIRQLEKEDGKDGCLLYCSEKCKHECRLFNKSAAQLIKEDQIKAGLVKELPYTSEEYNTWREEVLKRADYKCEYCGEPATHCHHIKPQKLEPFFSLDPDWGVATCDICHYKYGHPKDTGCSTGYLAKVICM